MNNKGQSTLSEYVMVFFVAVAALVAMTTYLKRGFEARINDATDYMINTVVDSGACDTNCMAATGGSINYEYEPYYTMMISNVVHNGEETTEATTGNAQVLGAIYTNAVNETTATSSFGVQQPPQCANGGC